ARRDLIDRRKIASQKQLCRTRRQTRLALVRQVNGHLVPVTMYIELTPHAVDVQRIIFSFRQKLDLRMADQPSAAGFQDRDLGGGCVRKENALVRKLLPQCSGKNTAI